MDIDLRLVRYFVVVASELHFGRAAAQLFVSQPALSKQIKKLETQVGEPLLVRDSRHVDLTPRGQRFYDEAQQLLAMADRLQRPTRTPGIRVAHIHELATSRDVCDAFAHAFPETPLLEHAMVSDAQVEALLTNRLDVAILRVTPGMVASHPQGWSHRLLRMEPMVIVGAIDEDDATFASLVDQPLAVFGDPVDSGTYNAYGEYLTALEQDLEITMTWLGTPGADMTDSVHEAFAATLAIVLGVNLMFSSFLMYLLLSEQVPAGSAPWREDHVRSRLPEES